MLPDQKYIMKSGELLRSLQKNSKYMSNNDIMKARSYMLHHAKYLPEKYKKAYSTELFDYYYKVFLEIRDRKINDLSQKTRPEEVKLNIKNSTKINVGRADTIFYNEEINDETYYALIEMIDKQTPDGSKEKYFKEFMKIIITYLIFIVKKPLHPLGMIFPGGMKITEINRTYYCPIKNKQAEVDVALCKYCICRDTEEVVKTNEDMW